MPVRRRTFGGFNIMQNKNPANTGGKDKLPGYPQDKNPAGTPDPRPEEFPGKAPDIYANKQKQDPKQQTSERTPPERRDPTRENLDVNQSRRRDKTPASSDEERPTGKAADRSGRPPQRQ
jgi:hypothetical protein